MNDIAKIFWTGRSQAVRLPKAYRFEGEAVAIRREGSKVILEASPEHDGWAWLATLQPMDDDAVASALDRPGADDPATLMDGVVSFD